MGAPNASATATTRRTSWRWKRAGPCWRVTMASDRVTRRPTKRPPRRAPAPCRNRAAGDQQDGPPTSDPRSGRGGARRGVLRPTAAAAPLRRRRTVQARRGSPVAGLSVVCQTDGPDTETRHVRRVSIVCAFVTNAFSPLTTVTRQKDMSTTTTKKAVVHRHLTPMCKVQA